MYIHACCNDFEMGGGGGGTSLMPAKKISKQVHGIIFILQKKWIVKEVWGGGGGMGVTAIAALWMMDLAVVVMR